MSNMPQSEMDIPSASNITDSPASNTSQPEQVDQKTKELLVGYYTLVLFGTLLCIVIILVKRFGRERARRPFIYHNLLISWVVWGLSHCIQLFIGRPFDYSPRHVPCAIEAAFADAANAMTMVALLCLTIYNYAYYQSKINKEPLKRPFVILLYLTPYGTLIGWLAIHIPIGLIKPELVGRPLGSMYCTIAPATAVWPWSYWTSVVFSVHLVISAGIWSLGRQLKSTIKQAPIDITDPEKVTRSQKILDSTDTSRLRNFLVIEYLLSIAVLISLVSPRVEIRCFLSGTLPFCAAFFLSSGKNHTVWSLVYKCFPKWIRKPGQ